MQKRVSTYIKDLDFKTCYPKLSLGVLVVSALCCLLIVIATFTQFQFGYILIPEKIFTSPFTFFSEGNFCKEFVQNFNYIPQIPVVLFIGALLGYRFGLLAILAYIAIGLLGVPIFGLGGGLKYILQPSFGYILGYLIGAFFVAKNLENNRSPIAIVLSSLIGVLLIHGIGILYLSIVSLLFLHQPLATVLGWIWILTGVQVIYDMGISIITVALARPIRALLWIAMG
jgi:biotin transport system substrate-specific component